jgi:hypothetical protein
MRRPNLYPVKCTNYEDPHYPDDYFLLPSPLPLINSSQTFSSYVFSKDKGEQKRHPHITMTIKICVYRQQTGFELSGNKHSGT